MWGINKTANTLREIYYNPSLTHRNEFFQLNEQQFTDYINYYNLTFNTQYDIREMKERKEGIKKYVGKLYDGEYSRHIHDKEYLNDFCNIKKKDISTKKANNIRLMSYNIHCFINSCNNYNHNTKYKIFKKLNTKKKKTIILNTFKNKFFCFYEYPVQIMPRLGEEEIPTGKVVIRRYCCKRFIVFGDIQTVKTPIFSQSINSGGRVR